MADNWVLNGITAGLQACAGEFFLAQLDFTGQRRFPCKPVFMK